GVDGDDCRIFARGLDTCRFDLILTPRAVGDEGDAELQVQLYVALAEAGALVVNDVRALLCAVDKFPSSLLLARAGLQTPRLFLVQRIDDARRVLELVGEAVVKPNWGSLGLGVERIGAGDKDRLERLLSRYGALYLQEYRAEQRDVRAF